jgi:signal transduction histidine kinase
VLADVGPGSVPSRRSSATTRAADRLDREIDAMDGLIADLLAAARINFEAVSPQDLDGVDLARRAIEIGGAPVEIVGGDAPVPVRADPTLLARALSGILDNARRYGARRVELRILSVGDVLRYEIADDGPGFGEGDEERAFQPFWRAPSSPDRPDPGGTGLGLALVRQIAQAHGGAAGARNRDGGGAVVWIELPR